MEAKKKRILVVNDTEEILELFRDILGDEHEVVLRSYAPHDLREIERAEPDLVIIDFVIGGREYEGWQLLQKLKMNRSTADLPVIICTAAVNQVREQEGYLAQQGVRLVMKPFRIDELESVVADALKSGKASL